MEGKLGFSSGLGWVLLYKHLFLQRRKMNLSCGKQRSAVWWRGVLCSAGMTGYSEAKGNLKCSFFSEILCLLVFYNKSTNIH